MVRQAHHEWPMGNRSRHICGTSPQKSLPLRKAVQPNVRQAGIRLWIIKAAEPQIKLIKENILIYGKEL